MTLELSSCFDISPDNEFYEISTSPEADHMLLIVQNPNGVFFIVEKSESDEEKHPAYIKYNKSESDLNVDVSWHSNDQCLIILNDEAFAYIDFKMEKVSCDSEINFGLWEENIGDLKEDLSSIDGLPDVISLRDCLKENIYSELKEAGASESTIREYLGIVPVNDKYSDDKPYLFGLSDLKALIIYSGQLSIGTGVGVDSSICLELNSGKIYYSTDYDKEEIAGSPAELIEKMAKDDFPNDLYEARDDMSREDRSSWRESKKEELKKYLIEQGVNGQAVAELIENLPNKPYAEAGGDFYLAEDILNFPEEGMVDLKNKIFYVGSCGNGDYVTMDKNGAIYFVSHEEGSWENFTEHSIKVANSPTEYSEKLGEEDFPFDYHEACSLSDTM